MAQARFGMGLVWVWYGLCLVPVGIGTSGIGTSFEESDNQIQSFLKSTLSLNPVWGLT